MNRRFAYFRLARVLALLHVSLLALLLATTTPAIGAQPPWKNARKFERVVEGKDLRELLREFAGSYGVSVVVDPQVSGTVTGHFSLTPQSTLEYLASAYGFVWYFDGNALNISPADSVMSDVIPLPAQNPERTLRTLEALGLMDSRYPITIDSGSRMARVSGPRMYVDMIRNAMRSMDTDRSDNDESVVRVFRLRYAYAADQKIDAGVETTVPGLVTVLSQIYPSHSGGGRPGALAAVEGPQRVSRVAIKGTNQTLPETPDAVSAIEAVRNAPPGTFSGNANNSTALPQFRADERLNAIIVRDLPSRMEQYEDLIKSLDTRPLGVEIEARIIEVSTSDFNSLGVDWRFDSGHVDIQSSGGPLPSLTYSGALNSGGNPFTGSSGATGQLGVSLASGAIATTVLGNAGLNLIQRISALAQEGKASITSSPRVLTLDNIEAVIEDSQQIFVRVASDHDAALFQFNSGTSLHVRPLVVDEGGGRQLKLAIRIEDGAPTSSVVDAIPILHRTSIGTWAFIKEGQSLLIGGFTQQQVNSAKSGVPFLSTLPVVGGLFRTDEKQKQTMERLFMITPRVVEL